MSEPDLTTVFPAENIKVGTEGLRRHLNLYLQAVGGGYKKLLKKQARLMCRDMLDYTLPVEGGGMGPGKGTSKAAQIFGQEIVQGEIERIFAPLEMAKYGEIARNDDYGVFSMFIGDRKRAGIPVPYYLQGDMPAFGDWIKFRESWKDEDQAPMLGGLGSNFNYAASGVTQIESIHKAVRGGPANYSTKNAKSQFFISDYQSKVPAYIRSVQKRVGRLKAGWFSTSVMLGDSSYAPAWIKSNQWGTGGLYDELDNKSNPAITIENKAHGRMSIDPGFRGFETALSRRSYAIRNDIIKVMLSRGQKNELLELARRAENADLFLITDAPF
jgi:hypothetical protein